MRLGLLIQDAREPFDHHPERISPAPFLQIDRLLAALILSAAMMMRIDSRFQLLGYPGFPTLLFVVAGSIGIWLVLHIVASDRAPKHKR